MKKFNCIKFVFPFVLLCLFTSTIDFPIDQHTYIKMLAAKEGISLRQFVIEHLPNLEKDKKKSKEIKTDEFDELLKELLVKKSDVLKRLSKK